MINSYGNTGHSLASVTAMLHAFSSEYKLSPFIASRSARSCTLGYYLYKRNTENKYLLLHAEPDPPLCEVNWQKEGGEYMSTGTVEKHTRSLHRRIC